MMQEFLEPWAITQDSFRALVDQSKALQARDATPVDSTRNVSMRGDVAVLHIKGPLFRYHNWITQILGCTSYGELRKDLQSCLDAGVKAILLVVDSPGGEVNGCKEMADALFAARGRTITAAYVSGSGASAAYFLGSAASKIYCAPTAMIGSIGVIYTLVDYSKADAAAGVKEYEIVSSQSPAKSQQPADASYRGRVQTRIDALADVFVSSVAQYRGVSKDTVLATFGQGDVFVGQAAIDAGLADQLSDVEQVIASLQAQVNQQAQQSTTPIYGAATMSDMKMMARRLGLEESASEHQIEEHALALSSFARDILATTGAKDTAEALGSVRAGIEAVAQRNLLQSQLKDQKAESVQAEFRAVMKDAFKDRRLSLGEASKILPMLKDEEASKAETALAAITEQKRSTVLDALCTAQVSEKRLKSIKAYIEKCSPNAALPAPKGEPPLTQENGKQVAMHSDAQLKEFGSKYGLSESAVKMARYDSVDQIPKQ